jgi:hypothetical protein
MPKSENKFAKTPEEKRISRDRVKKNRTPTSATSQTAESVPSPSTACASSPPQLRTALEIETSFENADLSPTSKGEKSTTSLKEALHLASELAISKDAAEKQCASLENDVAELHATIRALNDKVSTIQHDNKTAENQYTENMLTAANEKKSESRVVKKTLMGLAGRTQTDLMGRAAARGDHLTSIPLKFFTPSEKIMKNLKTGFLLDKVFKSEEIGPDLFQKMNHALKKASNGQIDLQFASNWNQFFKESGNHVAHDPRETVRLVGGLGKPIEKYFEHNRASNKTPQGILGGLEALLGT